MSGAYLIVAKHRNGLTAVVTVAFQGHGKFREIIRKLRDGFCR